jgi:hypothetical protein
MDDSYQDSRGGAPAGRRWSLWRKLLVGCGATVILPVLALAVAFYWTKFIPSGKHFLEKRVSMFMEEPWGKLLGVADAIQTNEGAKALYRDNPLLKGDYPAEDDFLKSASVWRGKVVGLPRTPPVQDWDERERRIGMRSSRQPGHVAGTLEVFYMPAEGPQIRLFYLKDEGLSEIDIR